MSEKCVSQRVLWQSVSLLVVMAVPSISAAQDAGSIKVGEADFVPSVRLSYLTNNNAYLTPSNETESSAFAVAPRFELLASRRLLDIALTYDGDYAVHSEEALSYNDHRLWLTADAEISSRQRVNGFFSLEKNHEVLGTSLTRGIANENTEQVEQTEFELGGSFTYGAAQAQGNVELGLAVSGRSFLNQDALTDGRDFTLIESFGIFTYRLSSTARALLELRYSAYNFDDDRRDRNNIAAFAGIRLAEGRKTSGTAKIGITQSSYSIDGVDDQSTVAADITLRYTPVSYSTFDLRFARELVESQSDFTGANGVEILNSARLNWKHQWSSRFRTDAVLSYAGSEQECPDPNIDVVTASAGFGVSVRRWLEIGADFRTTSRTSEECQSPNAVNDDLDFERQQISVYTRITL